MISQIAYSQIAELSKEVHETIVNKTYGSLYQSYLFITKQS